MIKSTDKPVVVIPNLNGGEALLVALRSLQEQILKPYIIVVDNGSSDGSAQAAQQEFPETEFIWHGRNKGYTGGVNTGFRRAIELEAPYVAPFNDDAVADRHWLKLLVEFLDTHPVYGATSCKVLKADGVHLDSTGDFLTNWGLPYPRGRDEVDTGQYDDKTEIFAASGAASLYRVKTLQQIGLLDQSFFAYYEDVDLSFRMQNAGWKIGFVPESRVLHATGMTSSRMKGFTTYQTLKNQPLLLWKNLPSPLLFRVLPRFYLAYGLFFLRAWTRRQGWYATKGVIMSIVLLFWKLPEITLLEAKRTVPTVYIWSMFVHDLPPNAHALRRLRNKWWRLRRKIV